MAMTVVGWPAMITIGGPSGMVMVKLPPGAAPVPERAMVWVAGVALSVSVRVAVRAPAAVGAKIIERMQEALGGTGAWVLHVVAVPRAKSGTVVPGPMAMEVKVSAVWPELVTVTAIGALGVLSAVLGKLAAVGFRSTTGPVLAVPVPVRGRVWVAGVALSASVRVAERAPAAAGVKITERMQVPAAATGV